MTRSQRVFAIMAGCAALTLRPLPAQNASSALDLARQLNEAFVQVAERVSPSVVVISVAQKPSRVQIDEQNPFWEMVPEEFRRRFENPRRRPAPKPEDEDTPSPHEDPQFNGQGSGVIIREDGYILTNRHVVDGAEKIKVRFADGPDEYEAAVRGTDPQSDLAVIKVDPKGKKLTPARFANSDKTRVGEFAIAIGAPFELDYSVTYGHVSAKGRSGIVGGREGGAMDQDFIQTDANINPGNSGGPLVNLDGEIIGINTLIRGLHTGIGFSVPSNLARKVAEKLIADGKYVRAWLGIAIASVREAKNNPVDGKRNRELYGELTDGVVVREIQAHSPAAESDLKPTDVITAVDGRPVNTAQQLRNEIRTKEIGSTFALDVYRVGKSGTGKNLKVLVKTAPWPDSPKTELAEESAPAQEPEKTFGLTVERLTADLASQYGVQKSDGVLITGVEKSSVADRKGLRPGDVVTEVDQRAVTTPKEFLEAIKAGDPKKGIVLIFTSRGTIKTEILKETGD